MDNVAELDIRDVCVSIIINGYDKLTDRVVDSWISNTNIWT
jgi:hypothetical protein